MMRELRYCIYEKFNHYYPLFNLFVRYPAISYEILISESPEIEYNFFDNNYELLDEAFSFFKSSNIDHHHARFVCHIIETLLSGHPKHMLDYMSSRHLLGFLVDHLSAVAIVDFLVKLTNLETHSSEFKMLFIKQEFMSLIVEKLSPSNSNNHSNIVYGFIDFMTKCNSISDELINEFQKDEILTKLFTYMFEDRSSFIYGSNVIIFITQFLSQSSAIYDKLPNLIEVFLKYLPKFADTLLTTQETYIMLPSGKTNIVGPVRIKTIELIECIISVNIKQIDEKILESDILKSIIKIYFEYENNSILHKNATFIFSNIIENNKVSLMKQLFEDNKLHITILEYLKNRQEKEANGEARNSCTAYILEFVHLLSKEISDSEDLIEILGADYTKNDIFNQMAIIISEDDEDSFDGKSVSYNSESGSFSSELDDNLDDLDLDDDKDLPFDDEINEYKSTDAEVSRLLHNESNIYIFLFRYWFQEKIYYQYLDNSYSTNNLHYLKNNLYQNILFLI